MFASFAEGRCRSFPDSRGSDGSVGRSITRINSGYFLDSTYRMNNRNGPILVASAATRYSSRREGKRCKSTLTVVTVFLSTRRSLRYANDAEQPVRVQSTFGSAYHPFDDRSDFAGPVVPAVPSNSTLPARTPNAVDPSSRYRGCASIASVGFAKRDRRTERLGSPPNRDNGKS